jgi:hypothetical protein
MDGCLWQALLLDESKQVWRNVKTNELTSTKPDPSLIMNDHKALLQLILTDSGEQNAFRIFSKLHQIEESLDFLLVVASYRDIISNLSGY